MPNNNISLKLEIERLIRRNYIEAAIDKLSIITTHYLNNCSEDIDFTEIQRNLVLKSGQFSSMQNKDLLGIISHEDISIETNRIRDDILNITNKIFTHPSFLTYSQQHDISQAVDSIEIKEQKNKRRIFLRSNILFFLFFAILTILLSSSITLYITSQSEKNKNVIANTKKIIPFSKTFTFWIPDFSSIDAVQARTLSPMEIEEKFNDRLIRQFNGFSRWNVDGQYQDEAKKKFSEKGWFYQVSLSKNTENMTIEEVVSILDEFFIQDSWYIAENKHDTR